MLRRLGISNYELIDHIDQDFYPGLNVITGETGTGKSMILSAIYLLSGGRGSDKVIKNQDKKAVLEAVFTSNDHINELLQKEELDHSDELIIRREFSPQGRSRAFINDSPVNLDVLKSICKHIIDIHSQDQTNNINDPAYQMELIDIYSGNTEALLDYKACFVDYEALKNEIHKRKAQAKKDKEELDFIQYQYDELVSKDLVLGELALLEQEKELLSKQEEIKNSLDLGSFTIVEKEDGILDQLYALKQRFNPLSDVSPWLKEIDQRIKEAYNELKDLGFEIENRKDELGMNPDRLQEIEARIALYYTLENKFKVSGDEELIALRESFKEKLDSILSVDDTILKLEEDLKQIFELLLQKATILHERRSKNALIFASEIENSLKQLGISHPKIIFDIQALENPNEDGFDEIHTLFSSNKDQKARRVEEVASGGEKSRLMLAIKSIIGSKRKINSMVFDEIDTGISGEVALKTGELLSEIGKNNQVISITHLPQVASKGIHHFKVSKNMVEKRTNVQMMKLSDENRIEELAEMLGGKNISESARKTAQELLK